MPKRLLPLALLTVSVLACSGMGRDAAQSDGREGIVGRAPDRARMVVKSASIDVVVEDPGATASKIEDLVAALGGYLGSSSRREGWARLSVRVPAGDLDAFLEDVSSMGEERSRAVSGTDVTDSHADIQAEIANLKSLRDRLRLLLDRAAEVDEVLEVERELTRVQTALDSLEARRQRIELGVRLSEVSVSLSEPEPKRILGPLGLLYEGTKWLVIKMFVISP
jgi:hypothetical protein